jgi:hypothetical protein
MSASLLGTSRDLLLSDKESVSRESSVVVRRRVLLRQGVDARV